MPLADRADFVLPPFTRLAWAGEPARRAWQEPLLGVLAAWEAVQREAVRVGMRQASLFSVPLERLDEHAGASEAAGLTVVPLGVDVTPPAPLAGAQAAVSLRVACCASGTEHAFAAAWRAGDEGAVAEALGVPACCLAAFRGWREDGVLDPTPLIAAAPANEDAQVEGHPECNVLWRRAGLRALHYLPCSWECAASRVAGRAHRELARALGLGAEGDLLLELLGWPVEWSSLHGISELRTPVFKVVARADATLGKHTVRWAGSAYPAGAPTGHAFPYLLAPHTRARPRPRAGAA